MDQAFAMILGREVVDMEVGDRQEDGTIFAGISPDTNKPMFVRPQDEVQPDGSSLTLKWKEAMEHAAQFEGHGREKGAFRLPTKGELAVLFQNRAKIGDFNLTGKDPEGWYWSSTEWVEGGHSLELRPELLEPGIALIDDKGRVREELWRNYCSPSVNAWMHRFLERDPDLWYFSKVSCQASLRLVCD